MGLLYDHSRNPHIKEILLSEMIARTVKHLVNAGMRKKLKEEDCKLAAVDVRVPS